MAAELGFPVEPCCQPLNNCSLYQPVTKPCRYNLDPDHWKRIDPQRFHMPKCDKAFSDESVCFHFAVLMAERENMQMIADAIGKISENVDELVRNVRV